MFIAVDIGTTSTKVILFDAKGNLIFRFSGAYPTISSNALQNEQNPDLVCEAVMNGLIACFENSANPEMVKGISFSAAMHSLIAVDKNCKPLTQCIIWSDNRAYKEADELNENIELANEIYKISGTPIHSMSPFVKLLWLKKNEPEIFNAAYKFIGIKEYILYRLTGQFIVDYSIASATGMLDIKTKTWSKKILKLVGIDESRLPELVSPYHKIVDSCSLLVDSKNRSLKISTNNNQLTTIIVGGSDGGLANWGSGAHSIGDAVISIGTSSAMRLLSDKPYFDAQRRTFCYVFDENTYLIGGGTNAGAGVLQWLHDTFYGLTDSMGDFLKLADAIPVGSENLLFLPYINGERAPIWDAHIRGSFLCLGALHTRAHAARAAMEGVVFHLGLLDDILKESHTITRIIAGGGFARSATWVQILADVLNRTIEITETVEISALGAAMVCAKGLNSDELPKPDISATYTPILQNSEKYAIARKRFTLAYKTIKDISRV